MAIKNLYEVYLVEHNDNNNTKTEDPIVSRSVYVLAKNPSQAHSKVVRNLGDKLIFIENIRYVATNDEKTYNISGVVNLVT